MLDKLKGKKTYLIAAVWSVVTFAYSIGYLDEHTYQLIQGILLPTGLATLRAGVK